MYCKFNLFQIGTDLLNTQDNKPSVPPTSIDKLAGYSVTDCSLKKEFLKPNEFEFTLRRDAIEKTDKTKNFSIVNDIIGKEVTVKVTVSDENGSTDLEFKGEIASVSMKGLSLVCVAFSEDAALQGRPKCRTFVNKKIEDIVDVVSNGISKKKIALHSDFKDYEFPYIVQYNESDYDFLVGLAKRFGAFFYYDTSKGLVFGKLPSTSVKDLSVTKNVASVSYELNTDDPNFRYVSHYYGENLDTASRVPNFDDLHAENLFKKAVKASADRDVNLKYYIDNPNGFPKEQAENLMDSYSNVMMYSSTAGMVKCNFNCYQFDVDLGSLVKIDSNGIMFVTSTNFTWDCNGSPKNEIAAMALPENAPLADFIFPPYMDINCYPKSSAQRAMVVNNVDPQNMGRVQVQFVWQINNLSDDEKKKLPWIRIAQPYGGSKDGKGFYVIPEKYEEVMVGFEHDNMEKPFVIGTLFHSADKNKEDEKQLPDINWCERKDNSTNKVLNEENEVKAFRTKKGHTIEFHDTKKGDGFIRIYGNESKKPNYDIILSTDVIKTGNNKDKEYEVTSADDAAEAKKDINKKEDYKAGKLRIRVCSNGGDIMLDAGDGDIIMNAQNIRINAKGNSTSYITGKNVVKVEGGQFVDVGSNSLMVKNDQTIKVGGKNDEEYTGKVSLKALDAVELGAKSLASKTDQDTKFKADLNFEAHAGDSLKMSGNVVSATSSSSAKIKGSVIEIEGSTNTVLKGEILNVEGTFVNLKATTGSRKGIWQDQ